MLSNSSVQVTAVSPPGASAPPLPSLASQRALNVLVAPNTRSARQQATQSKPTARSCPSPSSSQGTCIRPPSASCRAAPSGATPRASCRYVHTQRMVSTSEALCACPFQVELSFEAVDAAGTLTRAAFAVVLDCKPFPASPFRFTFLDGTGAVQYAEAIPPATPCAGGGSAGSCPLLFSTHGAGVDGSSVSWVNAYQVRELRAMVAAVAHAVPLSGSACGMDPPPVRDAGLWVRLAGTGADERARSRRHALCQPAWRSRGGPCPVRRGHGPRALQRPRA